MRGRLVSWRFVGLSAASLATVALSACGNDKTFKNNPRPPSPIVITAAILPDRVAVSPAHFGAGPISLVVTNQTETSQRLAIARAVNGSQQASGETGPINPHDTASLKADVDPGEYTVKVDSSSDGIKPAKLRVGVQRPSAQNDLLQP
jgi:hypothetical protein